MEILFESESYDRLETDRRFSNGFAPAVVAIYRRRLQLLRALHRESDLLAMRSIRYRAPSSDSSELHVVELDDRYCLLMKVRRKSQAESPQIIVVRIDDQALTRGTSP